jgi:hypothetical protein
VAKPTWLGRGSGALLGLLLALALGSAAARGDTTGPPVSTVAPELLGSPGVGKTLSVTDGTWSTSATFTYQWLRCSAIFTGCADILDATAATYTAVAADVGHVLAARVTASNAAGSASALSGGTGPVEAKPPGIRHRPWISGTKKVGHTVSETATRWTRSPYMFTDRWLRCSATGDACVRVKEDKIRLCSRGLCFRIENPAGASYTLMKKDVGHRIRLTVAAWNGAGRSTSTSLPTRIVTR